MKAQFQQFRQIAGLTAREAIRQPICLLLTLSCLTLMAVLPLAISHQLGEEGKLVRDSALALHFVFGLLLGGYAACTALSREIRSGTAATILSKAVSRNVFFLGKYGGVALVILAFSFCAVLGTVLGDRIAPRGYRTDFRAAAVFLAVPPLACLAGGIANFRRRATFPSAAFAWLAALLAVAFVAAGFMDRGGHWAGRFGAAYEWRIVPAGLLLAVSLLLLSALALAFATRLHLVPTLTASGFTFAIGLISDYLFGRFAGRFAPAAVLYALTPNLQHFWLADALTGGGRIPAVYMLAACGYAALYTAALLCLGAWSFRGTDVTGSA